MIKIQKVRNNRLICIRLFCLVLTVFMIGCKGQENTEIITGKSGNASASENPDPNNTTLFFNQDTYSKQSHSNLNGMVTEFVRKMYQDQNGNFWFGTNGNGIIRYDKHSLEGFDITEDFNSSAGAVRAIVEDQVGNIWFGTSSGLIKFDGEKFTVFSEKEGLSSDEVWGLIIDKNGLIWLGTAGGIYQFDGENFKIFSLPQIQSEKTITNAFRKTGF